jgi:pyruvate/2-oxoglutarate dehydrogenase complex dihydrolipoamide acyltransferase (E2) component
MRLHRFVPCAALSLLAICSMGAGRHRHPAWANRPVPAVNPVGTAILNGGLGGNPTANRMSATAAGQSLASAYMLLANADHDYNGHRVQAMESIRKAAKRLKISLQGKGNGGNQPQADSDAKLLRAQQILQQVQGSIGGSRRGAKVRQHVNEAIQHITTALQTR